MSIVVAYKFARDPADASVAPDGTVDWSRARPSISPDDAVALALARQVADASAAVLIAVTVGPAAVAVPQARKSALSRGPSRLLAVADDALTDADAAWTAGLLAALVRRVPDADLLVAGDASADEAAGIVPALVAAHLGWPCLLDASAAERTAAGWRVRQSVAGGSRMLEVTGPVVLACTSDAAVAPVPGMRDVLAAGSKPVDVMALADLGVPGPRPPASQRARPAAPQRRQRRFAGPDAAADLVAALRADGVLP